LDLSLSVSRLQRAVLPIPITISPSGKAFTMANVAQLLLEIRQFALMPLIF